MVMGTLEDLRDTQMSSKSNLFSRRMWPKADSTMASGQTWPYLARMSFSNEPPFTPMRMGMPRCRQASATAFTRSSPPMLPGLMRTLSAPAAMASRASL